MLNGKESLALSSDSSCFGRFYLIVMAPENFENWCGFVPFCRAFQRLIRRNNWIVRLERRSSLQAYAFSLLSNCLGPSRVWNVVLFNSIPKLWCCQKNLADRISPHNFCEWSTKTCSNNLKIRLKLSAWQWCFMCDIRYKPRVHDPSFNALYPSNPTPDLCRVALSCRLVLCLPPVLEISLWDTL